MADFAHVKKTNLIRSIDDVTDMIDHREDIKEQNLYSISLRECELRSKLHNLESWYLGTDPVIDKRRATIESELLGFERQKRQEETAAWKDVLSLRSELRNLALDLYKEHSRQRLFFYGGI